MGGEYLSSVLSEYAGIETRCPRSEDGDTANGLGLFSRRIPSSLYTKSFGSGAPKPGSPAVYPDHRRWAWDSLGASSHAISVSADRTG